MMEEWMIAVREFGFPIFVCIWFMFRTERIIKENTLAIRSLAESVKNLKRK